MRTWGQIIDMYSEGIRLSSGKELESEEIQELDKLIRIYDGICSYTYVVDNLDDDEINNYPELNELPLEVFEDINNAIRDIPTGDDEIDTVMRVIKNWRKKNGI